MRAKCLYNADDEKQTREDGAENEQHGVVEHI